MKRISDWVALVTFVVIVAGAAMMWPLRDGLAQQTLIESANRNQQTYTLYCNADYATAKAALLDHIRFLDRQNMKADLPNANSHAVDAMIFTVRLAKLEEKNGSADKAKYMQDATTRCTKLQQPWQSCAENILRYNVDQMDKAVIEQR